MSPGSAAAGQVASPGVVTPTLFPPALADASVLHTECRAPFAPPSSLDGVLLAQATDETGGAGAMVPGAAQPPGAEAGEPAIPERMQPQVGGMELRPGDVLSISIQAEPGLGGQFSVRPDGLIVMPLLGTVEAAGKTVTDLADDLTELLKKYVVNPIVSVIQIGGVPRVVSILGAVGAPGTYDVRQYPSVLTVLAAAGGPRPEADLPRALLVRDGERALIVSEVIEGEPVIPEDMALQAGDAIIVPSLAERSMRVAGAVLRPGLVVMEEKLTASRAVLSAGGPAETADLTAVQVLRGTERIDLNLRPILQPEKAREAEEASDLAVLIDDVLIVPQVHTQAVFVIGAVAAPGPQPAHEAGMASRAVVMAGGAGIAGDLSRAYILRDGQQISLDLTPLLNPDDAAEGEQALDAPVQAGDVVMVPDKRPIFVIGAVVTPGPVSPHQAKTVSTAIVLTGGLADDADKAGAYILRKGEQVALDLAALFDEGDASADLPLQPQDALIVPKRAQVFHLVGQVLRPGTYPLEQANTVLDAWALGGGVTYTGDMTACVLLRGEEAEVLNIEALLDEGDVSQNRELQAGDTLVVPEIKDEVYVFGQVVRPGAHPIREGDTVIDVIAHAGGPTAMAQINAIAFIRRNKVIEAGRRELAGGAERERGTRTRARGEELTPQEQAEQTRAEALAQKLAEGSTAVRLFDLAKVPPGDSRYLVQPGDVIYIPTLRERESELRRILTGFITSLLANALQR